MGKLIALASAITIDAAVCTAAIYIHARKPVVSGQNPLRLNKMHFNLTSFVLLIIPTDVL